MVKGWEKFWRAFDRARVVPRVALAWYMWQMYAVQVWFLTLKEPSGAQAAFVSTVWGAFALLLNFYMQQGVDWNKSASGEPHS